MTAVPGGPATPDADVPEFFDRTRIAAGHGSTRRRRPLLLLAESWSGADPGAEVLDFLSGTEVFGGLDRAALRELFVQLDPVHVPAGTVVVTPDRTPRALHLLAYGRLAVRAGAAVRDVGPGEVVGASALLADVPAGEEVRAVRDSLLLRLDVAGFERFARSHPASLLGLCRALVRAGAGPAAPPAAAGAPAVHPVQGTTIALLAAGSGRVPDELAAGLVAALDRGGGAAEVTAARVDAELGAGASGTELADPRNGRLLSFLHRVEAGHRFVVYRADDGDTAWTRRCLRQADRVLLVARAGTDPAPGPAERALAAVPGELRRDLVLLHPPGTAAPSGTAAWLAGRGVTGHHHVRAGEPGDIGRVARFLSGTARGLVLAGGGMRGFAHLGVMRALDEAGVPVDAVGGASIGSIMAGFYAAGLDHEQRLRQACAAMVEQGSMVGFTLPLVAVSSGRKVTRLLREEPSFTRDIEDLWLPYFCVSASLSEAREIVHRSGPAWRAIRASIAIPGVYPPVHDGTQLLVDGGVMNNLPVDVMAALVGDGPIVAVNLHRTGGRRPPEQFELSVSGWRVLASRLTPWTPRMRVPRLGDVLLRSLSLSTARLQRDRLGDRPLEMLLVPPVGRAGMLDFRAGPSLVEPAYRYATEVLERSPITV
ncbi:MAG: patatin-like phospholipase family protein [Pseudonocardiales bacterium]|nr:patatin-like phospholipase family protein [Pseudonocardiales bacterium]